MKHQFRAETRVDSNPTSFCDDRSIEFGTFECQYRIKVMSSSILNAVRLRLINYAYVDFCQTEFTVY